MKFIQIAAFVLLLGVTPAFSAEKLMDFPLNKDSSYDVYFTSAKNTVSTVRNVRVIDVISFQGITYLLIERPGMRTEKGMILFGAVTAILPAQTLVDSKTVS
jgi:hypothetical protein